MARFDAPNDGPNGLALDSGRIFGATDSDAFALSGSSGAKLWQQHLSPLPRQRVTVCPGLLGGVETPMAYAESRLFVPVVDLCGWGSAVARQNVASIDPARGKGRLVALNAATGRPLWQRRLPSPSFGCATVAGDVVFTSIYDGVVYAFATRDGSLLWQTRMRAGVNACPAVAGDTLLVGAGIPRPNGDAPELVAFGLDG